MYNESTKFNGTSILKEANNVGESHIRCPNCDTLLFQAATVVDMICKCKQCFQTLFNKRAGREYGQFRKPCSDNDDPKDKVRNKLKHYNLMLSYCNPNGEQHQNLKKEKEKWLRVGQRMTNK